MRRTARTSGSYWVAALAVDYHRRARTGRERWSAVGLCRLLENRCNGSTHVSMRDDLGLLTARAVQTGRAFLILVLGLNAGCSTDGMDGESDGSGGSGSAAAG